MKALVIAEKKSLLDKIMSAYRNHSEQFDFTLDGIAQAGHLFGLMNPKELDEELTGWKLDNFPWFPPHWGYKITENGEKKFAKSKSEIYHDIRTAIKSGKYDFIIHAGDPDQEGELLIRETLGEAGNTIPVMRFWVNASTEEEFVSGLKSLKPDDDPFYENQYQAALARQHADYLIGMNFSPVVSLKTGETSNVGRLKTFIVNLIVSREDEITAWKPSSTFEAVCMYKEGFAGAYPERFKKKEEAEKFYQSLSDTMTVISAETSRTRQTAPALFKLSTLQIAAGKMGYNAEDIQDIAQSLYDKEYLSYPRTSCEFINDKADFEGMLKAAYVFDDLQPFLDSIGEPEIEKVKKNRKYVRNDAVEDEGHQALTPTGISPSLSSLSEDEIDVLHMVYAAYVAIFLPPLVQDKTRIIADNSGYKFITTGKVLIDKGYTRLLATEITDKPLPKVNEGDILHVDEFMAAEKKAKCPVRYTDASLIEVLEHPAKFIEDEHLRGLGKVLDISIGRPSTRAPIIKQLIKIGYLEHIKGKGKAEFLCPTEKGIRNARNMSENSLCKADTTAQWEEKLENIRKGRMSREQFEQEIKEFVIDGVKELKDKEMAVFGGICKCKNCGGGVVEKPKLYSCLKCGAAIWKNNKYFDAIGYKLTKKGACELLSEGKTYAKGLKSKKGNTYDAYITAERTESGMKYGLEFADNREEIGICPKCGKKVYTTPKAFSCEDRNCGFALWKEDRFFESIGASPVNAETARHLLKDREVFLKNLCSKKSGKTFDATIKADFSDKWPKYKMVFDR